MEVVEDIVIVGGGIAGMSTSLGLHRLGIQSLVLEASDSLRISGYALSMWSNAWKALDALGIGDRLRDRHSKIRGNVITSANSGLTTSELSFGASDSNFTQELRCVNRKFLLETLENELPKGTIRYSSKIVNIQVEIEGRIKSIHLADGTIIKTKVLIGSDGVNSVVAKFLGLSKPLSVGRLCARGLTYFEDGHGFEPKANLFSGKGVRFGIIPCNDHSIYWFFTFRPSAKGEVLGMLFPPNKSKTRVKYAISTAEKETEHDPAKLKHFILSKLGKVSDKVTKVLEKTDFKNISLTDLRFRYPWELLWGNICKDNICVIGDALHPMTPDLGQGACSALEDSVVLSRFLGEALKAADEENQARKIQTGLEKFAKERRWRSFELISTAYLVGWVQQSDGFVMDFLRDKLIARILARTTFNKSMYDCGKLTSD